MNAKRFTLALLALTLVLAPTVATGQQTSPLLVDLTVGYRFVDVNGSEEMYRSQINEKAGVLIRDLHLVSTDWVDKSPMLDNLRLDMAEVGAGNKGLLRLNAGKSGVWRLKARWDRQELYSALPDFANPFYPSVVPGQQSYDRRRNILDADLEILPDCAFSPFVGYTWNQLYGGGLTTMHVGENDYRLNQDVNDVDQEVRVGANFHFGIVDGSVTQGWRKYNGSQNLGLLAPGVGNNTDPILGRMQNMGTLNDLSKTDVNAPITNAWLAINPVRGLKILGAYTTTRGTGDGSAAQTAVGTDLVSFDVLSIFKGLNGTAASEVNTKISRANARLEWNIVDGLDLTGAYTRGKRELTGLAVVTNLYTGVSTFTGVTAADVADLLSADAQMNRTEDVIDAALSYKALGPVALRVGVGQTKATVDVVRAPSLVISGGGDGTYENKVNRIESGVTFAMAGVTLGGDWRHETADEALLRIDFTKRDRIRGRLGFKLGSWLNLGGVAEWIDYKNDMTGVGLDGKSRTYYGTLDIVPAGWIALHGSLGKTKADSTIPVKLPYTYRNDVLTSTQAEDGNSAEGSVELTLGAIRLNGGIGTFQNKGSYGFRIDRGFVTANLDFTKTFGAVAEWRIDQFQERIATPMGDYNANRYGVYLRFTHE